MIDWTRVGDLRREIGEDDFLEIVDVFLEEAEETVEHLLSADISDLGALLHSLKGTALNLGFADLAGLCAQGEAALAADSGGSVDRTAIDRSFRTSRTHFLETLPTL